MILAKGFTLLEVLLSVAILGVVAGISLPVMASFNGRNDLDVTTQSIVMQLRRAGTYSRGANNDNQWGVHIQSGGATLFQGTAYASRDTAYDETTTFPSSFSVSGTSDVVFNKVDGSPASSGSITLTNTNSNETRTITFNAKGMVSY